MKMHSEYRLPVFITVDEMVKAGDEAAILAVNIFGDLEGRADLSYEQKEKALHLANEMLFQKLVTEPKQTSVSDPENQILTQVDLIRQKIIDGIQHK
ncbi:hypothetical protein EFL45_11150 [Weissella confusa]|uniref:hypothetical protein n=1 Tax=Weissella confusa TaxID=1583 RepID=UPI00223B1B51|nr:hypothetical protein [Weissella confusa]MCT0949930.1 hypothetical protein [Weissella confusa]